MVAYAKDSVQAAYALFPGLAAQGELHEMPRINFVAHQVLELLLGENGINIDKHPAVREVAAGIIGHAAHRFAMVIIILWQREDAAAHFPGLDHHGVHGILHLVRRHQVFRFPGGDLRLDVAGIAHLGQQAAQLPVVTIQLGGGGGSRVSVQEQADLVAHPFQLSLTPGAERPQGSACLGVVQPAVRLRQGKACWARSARYSCASP